MRDPLSSSPSTREPRSCPRPRASSSEPRPSAASFCSSPRNTRTTSGRFAGLQAAYAAVEAAWAATLAHARSMPAEAVDASVDGEWSLTQTMRHLILATDLWLGQAVLGLAQPFDPIGLPNEDGDSEAFDRSFFATASPSLDEVMAVRITRQQLVRDYLARVTAADLAVPRPNPHAPAHQETTLSCIGTILEEEWEHHRYVVRDLDALAAR